MQIAKIQLVLLMHNQVMEIQTNGKMTLTRMAQPFRTAFKKAVGLPKNASHLDVLMAVGYVYNQFNCIEEFYEYLNKPNSLVNDKPLVTPEMMFIRYGI